MFDEGVKAIKARCFGDGDHLGADARDFFEAQSMDLFGVQIGGGFLGDAEIVIVRTAGLRRYAG